MERYRDRRHARTLFAYFPFRFASPLVDFMNVFELTRALVDIESITGNEENVGVHLFDYLSKLTAQYGGRIVNMACISSCTPCYSGFRVAKGGRWLGL